MNKLMMKLTIGTEAIFFICLVVAYLYFWKGHSFQHESANHLNIKTTGIFSLFLFCSSFTFWRAEKNHLQGAFSNAKYWLIATIGLGFIFLFGQGYEYYKLIKEDVTISRSEFGSSFYTLTGFHGLHVLIGLIILFILLVLSHKGYLRNEKNSTISVVGIYWHFVDVVWLFVFTIVYVLPYIL